MAQDGVIKKLIKGISQREITDENQKKEQNPEHCLEELKPGQEEGMREFHLGPHVDCNRRGSL